jgi:arsenate reductase
LDAETISRFLEIFGDSLLNTRSTTWKGLTEAERRSSPADLLVDYPTLMKRPVIDDAGKLTLGWDKSVQSLHLG